MLRETGAGMSVRTLSRLCKTYSLRALLHVLLTGVIPWRLRCIASPRATELSTTGYNLRPLEVTGHPRFGETTYGVTKIRRAEPFESLFEMPRVVRAS